MRFLLGLVVLVIAIYALRSLYSRFLAASRTSDDQRPHYKASGSSGIETMIRCQQCGTYIPASEAIDGDAGKAFCSEDHRRRYISAR